MLKFKNGLLALLIAVAGVGLVSTSTDVEAKRLGGGRPAGMQRQAPARAPENNTIKPAQPANAAQPPVQAPPPAQPGKRSWMGPLAGLAAGLGIAALASHFGMGGALANFMTMALVAVAGVMLVGWLMRRFGKPAEASPQLAGAGASYSPPVEQPVQREAFNGAGAGSLAQAPMAAAASPTAALPAGFDVSGFERTAKMLFIRMQAANDAANIEDLRKFTTPELFASLRLDLQERGQSAQQTDVMQLDAEIADAAQEAAQLVVSVRFHGLIREEVQSGALPFNELWHFVKPTQATEWAIAGITPLDGV